MRSTMVRCSVALRLARSPVQFGLSTRGVSASHARPPMAMAAMRCSSVKPRSVNAYGQSLMAKVRDLYGLSLASKYLEAYHTTALYCTHLPF